MSKRQEALLLAWKKGYRVSKDGEIYSPISGKKLKMNLGTDGYKIFHIVLNRQSVKVYYHRLVALEKFGEKIFDEGIVCRHLNGNCLDNSFDNIAIGTQKDNAYDRPKEERVSHALLAANGNRSFSDEKMKEIKEFYNKTKSYKKTKEKFNISSSGTLHYMLNKEYVTEK